MQREMRVEDRWRGAGLEKERVAQKLDLSGMSLDFIPRTSLNLACITKLDLSNNNLVSIPESLTARLLNVEVLDVHSNQLTALPNSIGCLSKLKVLDVSGNLLESLPKSIEDCRALEELSANFNKLTRLPDAMGFELGNLRVLSVHSNKLVVLPFSTSHLTALRALDAHLNCLRALPDGLENLLRLERLNVSHNFHHLRELPYSLGLLACLAELDVSYNGLTALPDSVGCLAKLRELRAEGNPLRCPPPAVVEKGAAAVKEFLSARMRESSAPAGKRLWIGRLVKCATFSGVTIPRGGEMGSRDEFSAEESKEYHSFEYLARWSPRRLFSPKNKKAASPRRWD